MPDATEGESVFEQASRCFAAAVSAQCWDFVEKWLAVAFETADAGDREDA
jgi:hypothetical protein